MSSTGKHPLRHLPTTSTADSPLCACLERRDAHSRGRLADDGGTPVGAPLLVLALVTHSPRDVPGTCEPHRRPPRGSEGAAPRASLVVGAQRVAQAQPRWARRGDLLHLA